MECTVCRTNYMLVCHQCYNRLHLQLHRVQAQAQLEQKNKQLQRKLESIKIQAMIRMNEKHKRKGKIARIKERIAQLKKQIVDQQQYKEKLQNVATYYEEHLTLNQSEVQNLYLEDLIKKNSILRANLLVQKKQKKAMLDNLASVFGIDQKKYKIHKYFRFEDDKKNIIFTLENEKNGIPVIKANNEQIINYHPLEQDSQTQHEEQQMLINTLKTSSKFVVMVHRVFLSQLKLPYKMYFSRQFLYIGNSIVCFDTNLQLSSQHLLTIINMLQANIEYLAHTIGSKEKPFLILDRSFYQDLQKGQFQLIGSRTHQRKWKSFLKALRPSQIMQHGQQQMHSQMIVLSQYKKSQESDEEYFELLQ